ncbi:MAG: alpha/beta fold hydrolase [Bacteroidota bacterium]
MQKQLIGLTAKLFPNFFIKKAIQGLTTPKIYEMRDSEKELLASAEQGKEEIEGFQIQTYNWPGEGKKILMIHGWEGQAGNFAFIVDRLLPQGYNLFSFDGPAHGNSSKGPTSPFHFSQVVAEMIRRVEPDYLITHSFGGVATVFALSQNPDIEIEKCLLYSVPDRFKDRIHDIATMVGLPESVEAKLMVEVANIWGMDPESQNVSDLVAKTNVKKAMIIADRGDKITKFAYSENVAKKWPIAQFEAVEGTGHFRILKTEFVLEKMEAFING